MASLTLTLLATSAVCMSAAPVHAEEAVGIIGKNDWLFYRHEWANSADMAATNTSVDLIKSFSQALQENGITLVVAMVPLKARIYQAYVPEQNKLNPYMAGNYQRMAQALSSAGVKVVDLNTSFLQSAKNRPDKHLYFRLDSHWTPTGALLAAETVASSIDADAAMKNQLRQIPAEKYNMRWSEQAIATVSRDLVTQLPKGAPAYAPEYVLDAEITKASSGSNLLGDASTPMISLVGSSYSKPWTRFPDFLKFALQKDVLAIAVGADQGSWVGMETYLRDDAFQNTPPKFLIWEMPERDMRAPPAFLYREARYRSDNQEWLQRVSTMVQMQCRPAAASAKFTGPGAREAQRAQFARTSASDYASLQFSQAVDAQDYLLASISASNNNAAQNLGLEVMKGDASAKKWNITINADGAAHTLKIALPAGGKAYTALKIWPGETAGLTISDVKLCRLPAHMSK
ncbi:alginate O-acetyltransferase complex protein AlgJ [Undibacterium pigrum]|uniref:Alginate O-acetyltransferase complex protein AlgJ n=2 Tax=Undibacterium pigrum TaxID=401470 RepID=A0A318JGY8_9BURK|nr:alginate O-acetyltransferase complex protein AlgJ [Undibacterium pigrum]